MLSNGPSTRQSWSWEIRTKKKRKKKKNEPRKWSIQRNIPGQAGRLQQVSNHYWQKEKNQHASPSLVEARPGCASNRCLFVLKLMIHYRQVSMEKGPARGTGHYTGDATQYSARRPPYFKVCGFAHSRNIALLHYYPIIPHVTTRAKEHKSRSESRRLVNKKGIVAVLDSFCFIMSTKTSRTLLEDSQGTASYFSEPNTHVQSGESFCYTRVDCFAIHQKYEGWGCISHE